MQQHFFAPPPGARREGPKGQSLIPNFVCVLINKRFKTYQQIVSLCCLGNALGVGHCGHCGA